MKSKTLFTVILFSLALVSCAPVSISAPTNTPSLTATITPTSNPATSTTIATAIKTATTRPTMTYSPTITPLPPIMLQDIFSPIEDDIPVNQYGRNIAGFHSEITTDSDCRHSGIYGVRLTSTVPNLWDADWGIYYPFNGKRNPSEFKFLDFWVKGKSGNEILSIWAQSALGADIGVTTESYVKISSTEWRLAHIPLIDFIREYSFGNPLWIKYIYTLTFQLKSNSGVGSVCIDDISFVR